MNIHLKIAPQNGPHLKLFKLSFPIAYNMVRVEFFDFQSHCQVWTPRAEMARKNIQKTVNHVLEVLKVFYLFKHPVRTDVVETFLPSYWYGK